MRRVIEVRSPPSFVVVTDAKGQRWLNTRILSMREHGEGVLIRLDNGEEFKVSGRALDIAEYLQRPTVTIVLDAVPDDGKELRLLFGRGSGCSPLQPRTRTSPWREPLAASR